MTDASRRSALASAGRASMRAARRAWMGERDRARFERLIGRLAQHRRELLGKEGEPPARATTVSVRAASTPGRAAPSSCAIASWSSAPMRSVVRDDPCVLASPGDDPLPPVGRSPPGGAGGRRSARRGARGTRSSPHPPVEILDDDHVGPRSAIPSRNRRHAVKASSCWGGAAVTRGRPGRDPSLIHARSDGSAW